MAQHAAAVGHVAWRFGHQQRIRSGIGANDLVAGNAHPHDLFFRQPHGRHHHVLGHKVGAPAFSECDIDDRNDRAAQVEDAHEERWRQRHAGQRRPLDDFFYIQHREAEAFAAGTKYAVLPLRQTLFRFRRSLCQLRLKLRLLHLLPCRADLFLLCHQIPIELPIEPAAAPLPATHRA